MMMMVGMEKMVGAMDSRSTKSAWAPVVLNEELR